MKLPDAPWRKRSGMKQLLAALDAPQGETRFVGGSVRDTLLGLPVSDVDLATRLQPDEVMERLKAARIRVVPTGIAHGTVTAILRDGPVEITTLRRDVSTDGRRATIAYTGDWQEDAARRDFTINALSADPGSGEIFDYFEGMTDLGARRVRFIGDPLTRIAEDHLRILRFFRFHARFGGGEPDAAALDACTQRANDLMALSRERIADELTKLLYFENVGSTVALMLSRGILAPVIPEITEEGVAALIRLIGREHLLGLEPDPMRRLAALLPRNPEVARAVGARLKLSNGWRARLEEYSEPGDRLQDPRALAYCIGPDRATSILLLDDIPDPDLVEAYARIKDWEAPSFPVKGGDLIAMGLPKGPIVTQTLHAVLREWMARGFPADEEAVRALARAQVDQALRERQ